jgi:hypothetical protein
MPCLYRIPSTSMRWACCWQSVALAATKKIPNNSGSGSLGLGTEKFSYEQSDCCGYMQIVGLHLHVAILPSSQAWDGVGAYCPAGGNDRSTHACFQPSVLSSGEHGTTPPWLPASCTQSNLTRSCCSPLGPKCAHTACPARKAPCHYQGTLEVPPARCHLGRPPSPSSPPSELEGGRACCKKARPVGEHCPSALRLPIEPRSSFACPASLSDLSQGFVPAAAKPHE